MRTQPNSRELFTHSSGTLLFSLHPAFLCVHDKGKDMLYCNAQIWLFYVGVNETEESEKDDVEISRPLVRFEV